MTQVGLTAAVGCLTLASLLAGGTSVAGPACAASAPPLVSDLATVFEAVSGHGMVLEPTAAGQVTAATLRSAAACASGRGQATRYRSMGHPIAWDALSVVVHLRNPHLKGISLSELGSVLAGEIVNWRQLGGADAPLELQILANTRTLSAQLPARALPGNPTRGFVAAGVHGSAAELVANIERNPNAIGIITLSEARNSDVRVLALEGVIPGRESIGDGSYLLTTPLYVAHPLSGPEREHAEALIEFAHSQTGRQAIRKLGAVPYLEALHLADRRHEPVADVNGQTPGGTE